jgi:hypothetical protein
MCLRRLAAIAAAMSLAPVALFLVATGCSENGQVDPAAKQQAATPVGTGDRPVELENVAVERNIWSIYLMQGKRVGYDHTTLSSAVSSGKKVMVIDQLTHLKIKRFSQNTEIETRLRSVETPDGGLTEFSCEMRQGTTPLKVKGRVQGKRLNITTTTKGNTSTDSILWSPEFKGFLGGEQSLLDSPMQPGQKRTIHALMAILNQVATIKMVAGEREPVQLLTGTYELLKIEATITLPDGQSLHQTIWCDRAGNGLKSVMKEMGLETFLATKAPAREETQAADLGWSVTVGVDGILSRPHQSKQIRYRVHLDGSDPAKVFVSGASQRVESIDRETADLIVYAIRPGSRNANPDADGDKPTVDDLRPNNHIQSDHAKVVALAREACGDETDAWKTVVKLERFVNDYVSEKDYSQAFATAAEVAENPVGDCSEHAVLLAALARARGIPARVAMGLVFVADAAASPEKPADGKFIYHMWTEVYIDELWIPIDATLAMGGIGAGHLKLAHSNLKGASAFSSFIPVAQVIGRLKIQSRQDPDQR